MITENMIKTVNNIHRCMVNNLTDDLSVLSTTVDLQTIGEELLNNDNLLRNESGLSYNEMLKYFIEFCSYIENETDEPSSLSDEVYDELVEKLIDLGEPQHIGSILSDPNDADKVAHSYPELRGSLAKVHFIWEKDIPPKDSRKSLEGYLRNAVRQLKDAGVPIGETTISIDFKYDGVSHIIECTGKNVNHILTRGDVEKNLGKDLTPLFTKFFPDLNSNLYCVAVPGQLWEGNSDYGIKVETYMKTKPYEEYKEKYNVKRCNRRSAVVSICNQLADNVEYEDETRNYLSMMQFQVSSKNELSLDEWDEGWYYIGKVNDRFQYLYLTNVKTVNLNDIDSICNLCSSEIDRLKGMAEERTIPIDGIVVSFNNPKIVNVLGRNNDKNMFQIAFKFPAGEEKTIVDYVDFQVGAITGVLTPVAKVKPIKINGNTITNVTISNKDKMDRLKIHEGDEVIIKYDIVPTIFKDSTCKESDNPLVKFPTHCPICEHEIVEEKCVNPDCPAKTVGHIYNFVKRNRIGGGIGLNTIIDFTEAGYLDSIGDLYRLYRYRDELCKLPGYGETSIDSIIDGIAESRKMRPDQLFGSIGIPNIGVKTMEKVCRKIDIVGNLGNLGDLIDDMTNIVGIGSKKAIAILEGIQDKIELIKDICTNIELVPYGKDSEPKEILCFTNVRDKDFEKFLIGKGIGVSDNFTSKVTLLITPDGPDITSSKITKAKAKGIAIMKISDAYKKYGYQNL